MVFLSQQLYSQYRDYHAQPVSSIVLRRQAPFPRLTLCPRVPLKDTKLLYDAEMLLTEGGITVEQFYNMTTLDLLECDRAQSQCYQSQYNMMRSFQSDSPHSTESAIPQPIPGTSWLGSWRARYYLALSRLGQKVDPIRCLTFEPSQQLRDSAEDEVVNLNLRLKAVPLFQDAKAYRLFVHDTEEPNVGDLAAAELGPDVEQTASLDIPPEESLSLRLTARMFSLANLWRRPCREESGYSAIQCLKECLWHRLAANISCRLPHMVGAGVYLPDMSGPLDHLPLCARLVQMESKGTAWRWRFRFCKTIDESCTYTDVTWYRPSNLEPLGIDDNREATPVYDALRLDPELQTTSAPRTTIGTETLKRRPRNSEKKTADFNLGICNPPEDLETVVDDSLLTSTKGCHCPPACHQTLYNLFVYKQETYEKCSSELTMSIDLRADEIGEAITFTLPTLLANIGGMVGIVTGYSMFTLAGAGVDLAWKFIRQ
ncbi:hypothetical protein FJT64_001820 [Amphibalanus amphitrite]|uniref:Uncharacterized protein n=1 Tax=Amphibalanus amphitrite TaxID=1232801 RepID=A0A6A4WYG4_AMPAM|nr:hypothetical protein FJT64_001820 [Amphibalanus amphitrite]